MLRRARTPRAALPSEAESAAALRNLLSSAGLPEPVCVTELTAGFCNWVYKVELEGTPEPVVAKLFSPLAKLRLPPSQRGLADELASQRALGPQLLHRGTDGLITAYLPSTELSEADVHAADAPSWLLTGLADNVARLHGTPLPDELSERVALWQFLDRMLDHIALAPEALPPGVTYAMLESETARMRERFEAFQLPVVNGHGDLKPSNVMQAHAEHASGGVDPLTFIDFELGGLHYRGYDLFKLFRTSRASPSATNRDAFLVQYADKVGARVPLLQAETAAFEPLSWLEAAVFFFFAIREFPEEAHRWDELAAHRWSKYIESRHLVDRGGAAATALHAARMEHGAAVSVGE